MVNKRKLLHPTRLWVDSETKKKVKLLRESGETYDDAIRKLLRGMG